MPSGVVNGLINVDSELQIGTVTERGSSNKYAFFQDLTQFPGVRMGEKVKYILKAMAANLIAAKKKVAVDLVEEPA